MRKGGEAGRDGSTYVKGWREKVGEFQVVQYHWSPRGVGRMMGRSDWTREEHLTGPAEEFGFYPECN